MDTASSRRTLAPLLSIILLAVGLLGLLLTLPTHSAAEVTQQETAPPPAGRHIATFAAGCFWSMQAIFQQLKGVDSVDPGYAGGTLPHPSYEQVETGNTGYAEAVNIVYNPKVITYNALLRVLLTVRDPTTLNQQGPDVGTNYRSVIFYRTPEQKIEAEGMIHNINQAHLWRNPIVTTVVPFTTFWRAESYHFDYYRKHPNQPYCADVIAPEIAQFRAEYPALLKQ